jgi:uncharacterized protein (DUF885 family)
MPSIDSIAEEYVERATALAPIYPGIAGHDDELADLSVDGFAERAELDRSTVAALDAAEASGPREQVAWAAMRERLALEVERYDAGDTTSELNVTSSWVQWVREIFDLMPTDGEQAAANIAKRMAAVPEAYGGLSQTLLDAARNGRPPALLQAEEVAKQCAAWAKPGDSFYPGLVQRLTGVPESLRGELDAAARAATAATAELGAFLSRDLLPLAREKDACGPEVYSRASRYFLGATVDLAEAYAWSWEEIARVRAAQARVSSLIKPGATLAEAMAILDGDPARRIEGRENFRVWMQELADRTISELHGTHFDIPAPAHLIEAMIAPVDGGGIYYSWPSEDWSRPGQMWWSPPEGMDTFSTWKEVTNVYHEGAPGHHLQIAQTMTEQENLNRWQRHMGSVSGHGEGWATYSERLMGELGYLDDLGAHLGMLSVQLEGAAIVALDIGLNLELQIPVGAGWREGERWNAEIAWEFLRAHSSKGEEELRPLLHRFLGWPGQATSYRLGERIWLQAREEAKARAGDAFSLKDFHSKALSLGSMGFDPLIEALARI